MGPTELWLQRALLLLYGCVLFMPWGQRPWVLRFGCLGSSPPGVVTPCCGGCEFELEFSQTERTLKLGECGRVFMGCSGFVHGLAWCSLADSCADFGIITELIYEHVPALRSVKRAFLLRSDARRLVPRQTSQALSRDSSSPTSSCRVLLLIGSSGFPFFSALLISTLRQLAHHRLVNLAILATGVFGVDAAGGALSNQAAVILAHGRCRRRRPPSTAAIIIAIYRNRRTPLVDEYDAMRQ